MKKSLLFILSAVPMLALASCAPTEKPHDDPSFEVTGEQFIATYNQKVATCELLKEKKNPFDFKAELTATTTSEMGTFDGTTKTPVSSMIATEKIVGTFDKESKVAYLTTSSESGRTGGTSSSASSEESKLCAYEDDTFFYEINLTKNLGTKTAITTSKINKYAMDQLEDLLDTDEIELDQDIANEEDTKFYVDGDHLTAIQTTEEGTSKISMVISQNTYYCLAEGSVEGVQEGMYMVMNISIEANFEKKDLTLPTPNITSVLFA